MVGRRHTRVLPRRHPGKKISPKWLHLPIPPPSWGEELGQAWLALGSLGRAWDFHNEATKERSPNQQPKSTVDFFFWSALAGFYSARGLIWRLG